MPSSFLGPSKAAGNNVKKSENFEKLSLEKLEMAGSFCEMSPENRVVLYSVRIGDKNASKYWIDMQWRTLIMFNGKGCINVNFQMKLLVFLINVAFLLWLFCSYI